MSLQAHASRMQVTRLRDRRTMPRSPELVELSLGGRPVEADAFLNGPTFSKDAVPLPEDCGQKREPQNKADRDHDEQHQEDCRHAHASAPNSGAPARPGRPRMKLTALGPSGPPPWGP